MRASPLVVLTVATAAALTAGPALAQSYNADGTPAMIAPDGTFPDGGVPAEVAAPSMAQPGQLPVQPSLGPPATPIAPMPPTSEERFDIDCDPDIDVCVDPNEQQDLDDGYDPNAYQQFEPSLSPYGTWFDDPTYGRVWTPSPDVVGTDFTPYATDGQWVASNDYGMVWASDYDWGWAPFHYGRWLQLDGWGWAWIPGTIWGPAWVDWRYGGGYCGWAPLPPRGVVIPPPRSLGSRSPWRFALTDDMFRRKPNFVPAQVVASIWNRTAPVHNARAVAFGTVNARINLGPPIASIAHDLGRPVPTLALKNTAPSALPRSTVVARAGMPLTSRPYVRSAPPMRTAVTLPHQASATPSVPAPPHYPLGQYVPSYSPVPRAYYAPPAYHAPTQTYAAPAYQAPARSYVPPAYSAPAQAYSPPPAYYAPVQTYSPPSVYHPPVQAYSPAPAYHAPVQAYSPPPVYHAPVQAYSPAPAYSAPVQAYSAPVYHAPAAAVHVAPAPAPAASFSRPSVPSFGSSMIRRR